jgi:hypothetical protein
MVAQSDGKLVAVSEGWSVKLWGDTKKDVINKFREMCGNDQRFSVEEA